MRWITVFLLIKFLWKFANGLVLECKCWLLEVLSRLVLTPSKPRYWSLGYLSFIFFSSILLLYHFGFVLHHCVFKPKHNVSPIWQLMKKACFHSSMRMLFYFYFYYCYFFLSLILLIFSPHFSRLACLFAIYFECELIMATKILTSFQRVFWYLYLLAMYQFSHTKKISTNNVP